MAGSSTLNDRLDSAPAKLSEKLALSREQWVHIATLVIAALCILPALVTMGLQMLGEEYYQHYPVLLIAAIGFAYYRLKQTRPSPALYTSARNLLWLILTVGLTSGIYIIPSRWMATVAAFCWLVSLVDFYGEKSLRRVLFGPLAMAFIAIPLPVGLDQQLVVTLQQFATWLASRWLDLVGVMHFATGVDIRTASEDFLVEDACSGIHSLFAALAVATGYAAIRWYGFIRTVLIVTQTLCWVVLANCAPRVSCRVSARSIFNRYCQRSDARPAWNGHVWVGCAACVEW